jgi:hypothetical protein
VRKCAAYSRPTPQASATESRRHSRRARARACVVEHFDTDGDGTISANEFLEFCNAANAEISADGPAMSPARRKRTPSRSSWDARPGEGIDDDPEATREGRGSLDESPLDLESGGGAALSAIGTPPSAEGTHGAARTRTATFEMTSIEVHVRRRSSCPSS